MGLMDEFQARRLVNTYADMILRISYQYLKQTYDAEDICQTVFLKYISNDMTFDSIEHEKAWIIRTAINYPWWLMWIHWKIRVIVRSEIMMP